ncbi:MAG: hypothetical protein GKS00_24500 [Alphaproteobacteria bacterium]|nr:hypothetical protein [Alphaproteobacteria bacterium]
MNFPFRLAAAVVSLGLSSFLASPALAHAFGQRYDLPAPLGLYLGGAGAAVALSFIVMAFVLRGDGTRTFPVVNLSAVPVLGAGAMTAAVLLRVISVAIFLLVLAAGFLGVQNPLKNFAPTMVWIIWWIGLVIVSALFGDLWKVINPWGVVFGWVERLIGQASPHRRYPEWLGTWPAVALFALFAWLELVSEVGESPRQLAYLVVIYSIITWWGMAVYGRETWLTRGEAFTVAFSLFARFAPMGAGDTMPGQHSAPGNWILRPPAVGLLTARPVSLSLAAFVLLILSTVTFDGFLETPAWGATLQWIAEDATLRPLLIALQESGLNLHKTVKTVALILFPLGFASAFVCFCFLVAWAGGAPSVRGIAGFFVLTLVPIAIAYHVAHYLSYLLLTGQQIIPLLSDPFGMGWDIFGTAAYKIDIGIVGAKFVWYLSVVSIVGGHLIAVYLAHIMALRVFPTARAALYSQIPMMVLMVGYTVLSLWILSQPVVETGMPGS